MTARRRSPKARLTTEPENGDRHTGVLLEDLLGKIRVVVERVLDTPTRRDLGEFAARTEARMDLLSDALRLTRGEIGEIGTRLEGVEKEIRGVRQEIAGQAQGAELRALEQRMTVVERHLGL